MFLDLNGFELNGFDLIKFGRERDKNRLIDRGSHQHMSVEVM